VSTYLQGLSSTASTSLIYQAVLLLLALQHHNGDINAHCLQRWRTPHGMQPAMIKLVLEEIGILIAAKA
jgi:hypothetical protein